MKKQVAAALISAFCLSAEIGTAQATEDEIFSKAVSEVAGELQQCSIYYFMVAICTEPQNAELSTSSRAIAERLNGKSIALGRKVGVSDQAYEALSRLEMDDLKKSMDGNCINIAVPMKKYLNFCTRLANDDKSRFKEWFACIQEKSSTCDGP
jgi:hypothetical protein